MSRLKRHRWVQASFRTAGLVGLAALLVGAFLGISEWYMRSLNDNKTVVLDKSMFHEPMNSFFNIDSIIKRHIPETVREAKPLDSDRLLIVAESRDSRRDDLSVFNLATNHVEPILQETHIENLAVSPSRTQLMYNTNRNGEQKIVAYDLKTGLETGHWSDGGKWPILLNDHQYVELYGDELRFQNLDSSETHTTFDLKVLEKYSISFMPDTKMLKDIKLDSARVMGTHLSLDLQQVYLQLYLPVHSQSVLLAIMIDNGATGWVASGNLIEFVPVKQDKLLIYGRFGGVEGLYVGSDLKDMKLLAEGSFNHLTFNPVLDTIAYAKRTEDGGWKVMIAKLDAGRLSDEYTVYSDPGYVRSLQWSPDGKALICITDETSGSNIYQFRLR